MLRKLLRVFSHVGMVLALWSCSDHARLDGAKADTGVRDNQVDASTEFEPSSEDAAGACAAPCEGTCIEGRCLVALAAAAWPADIAVDDTRVYFTSCDSSPFGSGAMSGAALSVPLGGGPAAILAAGAGCAVSLALGGMNLYVAGLDAGDIASIPPAGGPLTSIASTADKPLGIAVGGSDIYWATQGGALRKMPLSGGPSILIGSCPGGCTRPVVEGSDVYWGDSKAGTIQTLASDSSAPMTLTSGLDAVGAMAISGDHIYFASGYQLGEVSIQGGTAANVGLPTGAPVGVIAADDANIYFASWGSIWKIGFTDVEPTRIATNQGDPNAIAVDSTSVYWTNADAWPSGGCCGQVMRLTPK